MLTAVGDGQHVALVEEACVGSPAAGHTIVALTGTPDGTETVIGTGPFAILTSSRHPERRCRHDAAVADIE